jgi:hypothetical protein
MLTSGPRPCLERDRLLEKLYDAASRQLEITKCVLDIAASPQQNLLADHLDINGASEELQAAWNPFNQHTHEHGCKLAASDLKN